MKLELLEVELKTLYFFFNFPGDSDVQPSFRIKYFKKLSTAGLAKNSIIFFPYNGCGST